MKDNYEFSYKNDKNVSFLTVNVSEADKLVHYQLKMMENNKIPGLLPMSVSEHNGAYELFYDITSRLTLEQLLSRENLDEGRCIKLIEAFASAAEELPEYQLSVGGIIADLKYIYVRPSDFDIGFVFLPDGSDENDFEQIRNCLRDLVMKNKLTTKNGEFISSLLTMLNAEKLDAELMKKFCKKYKVENNKNYKPFPDDRSKVIYEPHNGKNPYIDPNNKIDIHQPYERDQGVKKPPEMPVQPVNDKNNRKKNKPVKNKNIMKDIIFIILQGVFVSLIFLAIQNGLLNDKDGNIEFSQLAGVALIFFLVDFLIFRRLFKNTSEKNAGVRKETDRKNKDKERNRGDERPLPESPFGDSRKNAFDRKNKKEIPVQGIDRSAGQNVGKNINIHNVNENNIKQPPNYSGGRQENTVQNGYNRPANQQPDYDMTVVMGDVYSEDARFTWYVNGIVHRAKMTGNNMIAGRQKGQVDILIQSRMVGHIHAEFKRRANGEYTVTDCNSKNGTYINGSTTRITSNKEYVIHNGDIIRLADTELTFEC